MAIEAHQSPKETAYSSNLGTKGSRELRRLSCSINYDSSCGSAICGRVKGGLCVICGRVKGGLCVVIMKPKFLSWNV